MVFKLCSLLTGNSLTGSSGTGMNRTFLPNILLQPITDKKMFELHDYPFLTMTRYPPGFIKRLGNYFCQHNIFCFSLECLLGNIISQ